MNRQTPVVLDLISFFGFQNPGSIEESYRMTEKLKPLLKNTEGFCNNYKGIKKSISRGFVTTTGSKKRYLSKYLANIAKVFTPGGGIKRQRP